MDIQGIAQALAAIGTPLLALVGVGGRKKRLRNDIRENLELVKKLGEDDVIREHTMAMGWVQGRIAVDVARLAGQPLGARKKPIPKGSVFASAMLAAGLAYWTYRINRGGFVWYSVAPGTLAALFLISIFGMTTNRELPSDETQGLPPGATPVRSGTAQEQIASAVHFAATGDDPARFSDSGSAGVAIKFVGLARDGRYIEALDLADANWLLCRLQAWVWNNRTKIPGSVEEHSALAADMLRQRGAHQLWSDFVNAETAQFAAAWAIFDPASVGAASKRRRVAAHYDVVVLVALKSGGDGYFVTAPTLLPDSLTILMHRTAGRWLVANHVGMAPPAPGMPPTWWGLWDPAIEALPEPE